MCKLTMQDILAAKELLNEYQIPDPYYVWYPCSYTPIRIDDVWLNWLFFNEMVRK